MRELIARLRDWLRRDRLDAELSEELRFHRQLLERDAIDAGAPAGEATYQARRRLGNVTNITEAARERWSLPSLEHLMQDVRYAWRALRRAPGFALVAVFTLALGIASTTAVFSLVDFIVLRGLPYRDADRIAAIYERKEDGRTRTPSYPTFADWQAQAAATSDAVEGIAFIRGDGVKLDDSPERSIVAFVTPGFFPLMGTRPALGRTFTADEERAGAARVAVISWQLFLERFGGDAGALGRSIDVDGVPTTVIGVMPHAFVFPNFTTPWVTPRLWQPISVFQESHPQLSYRGLHADSRTVIRMKQGASSETVAAAMRTIQQRLAEEHPVEQAQWTSIVLQPVDDQIYGNLRKMLSMIWGAIGLVLLLACANVANLFLVRGSLRSRELAVRTALGAGRFRLVRQLTAEAALLAAAAGVSGTLLALGLLEFVRRSGTERLPFVQSLELNGRTTAFAIGISMLTALAIGVLPALRIAGGDLMRRLRGGGTAGRDRRDGRLRYAIVSLQFAVAVTLLVGAGLLIQSFRRVANEPLGYDPNGVVTFGILPPEGGGRYEKPADLAALYVRIIDRMRQEPGVTSAAMAGGGLLLTPVTTSESDGRSPMHARYHPVSTEYLATMRVPLLSGRWFTDEDMRAPLGFVVNQKLARQLDAAGNAIGKQITVRRSSQDRATFGAPITLPVIGVVGDMRQSGAEFASDPEVFLPYTLEVWPWMNFVARTTSPDRLHATVDRLVRDVEPGIEFRRKPMIMRAGTRGVDAQRRFLTLVIAGFAGSALLLACVGLYSVVAYGVAQRHREFGVRIALGASDGRLVRHVLRDSALYVGVGAGLGLGGAWLGTRVIQGMLFQTAPTDLPTILAVTGTLAGVSMLAAYGPARRATRSDPMLAIRSE